MATYKLDHKYSYDDEDEDDEFHGRRHAHDVLRNLFANGLDDQTSNVSTPEFSNGTTIMPTSGATDTVDISLNGRLVETIAKVSALPANDRVKQASAYIGLDDDENALYGAFSDLINEKNVWFTGPFDCPNEYVLNSAPPVSLYADCPVPYIFKTDSPIRGRITFNDVLEGRHIVIVNVSDKPVDTLHDKIAHNTVIYLGGQHDASALPRSDISARRKTGFTDTNCGVVQGPAVDPSSRIFLSFPLQNAWRGSLRGSNVAVAELRNGSFLYWGTDYSPPPGVQLSVLPSALVPLRGFVKDAPWPPPETDTILETIARAWVMRGECLVQIDINLSTPAPAPLIIDALRVGFVRLPDLRLSLRVLSITSRIEKVLDLLRKVQLPGFTRITDSTYTCTLDDVSRVTGVPVPGLAAFIASSGMADKLFTGVSYACRPMNGPLKIIRPVRIAHWIQGLLVPTNAGLLYSYFANKYFSVVVAEDVARLVHYAPSDVAPQPTLLSLPNFIA